MAGRQSASGAIRGFLSLAKVADLGLGAFADLGSGRPLKFLCQHMKLLRRVLACQKSAAESLLSCIISLHCLSKVDELLNRLTEDADARHVLFQ